MFCMKSKGSIIKFCIFVAYFFFCLIGLRVYLLQINKNEVIKTTPKIPLQSKHALKAEIKNVVKDNGTYQIQIQKNTKENVAIQVEVWQDASQNDVYQYDALKQEDGTYLVEVDSKNHFYHRGAYHTQICSQKEGMPKDCIKLEDTILEVKPEFSIVSDDHGNYTVTLRKISYDVTQVEVPTWSLEYGQDDYRSYQATKVEDGTYQFSLRAQDHVPNGAMVSNIYGIEKGEKVFLEGQMYQMEIYQYNPVYYSQRDALWSNQKIGLSTMQLTGCVPTSLAMAYTAILGRSISPLEVASYLYTYTDEFNKTVLGASGSAIQKASSYYGVNFKGLQTLEEVQQELSYGRIVVVAVGKGTYSFTMPGYTHEIVLYGNADGFTNVYDPNDSTKNGKYYLGEIYNQRSMDAYDLNGGYVFYSLY